MGALLLPEDWWHATCAVDDFTAAIGSWMMDQRRPMLDPDIVDEARGKQKLRMKDEKRAWHRHSKVDKRTKVKYDDTDDMLAKREDHKNGGQSQDDDFAP